LIHRRKDFDVNMQCLTQVVANCVANYGKSKSKKRLVWAAPVTMGDYRLDANYDDQVANLSGRLPNIVKDSNEIIHDPNLPTYLMNNCDFSAIDPTDLSKCEGAESIKPQDLTKCNPNSTDSTVLAWCGNDTAAGVLVTLWKNWKDHFFYDVANAYQPAIVPTPTCDNSDLLTNNDCVEFISKSGTIYKYAAIVKFAGKRVGNQVRNATPDTDTKQDTANYLEANTDLLFNDTLYCIEENTLKVIPCPLN